MANKSSYLIYLVLTVGCASPTPTHEFTLGDTTVSFDADGVSIAGPANSLLVQLPAAELWQRASGGATVPVELVALLNSDSGGFGGNCEGLTTRLVTECGQGGETGFWCPGILHYGLRADTLAPMRTTEVVVCTEGGYQTQVVGSFAYGSATSPDWSTDWSCVAPVGGVCYRRTSVSHPISARRRAWDISPQVNSILPVTTYRSVVRYWQ